VKEMTYLSAFIEAMREEMERDERVFYFGQGAKAGGPYNTAAGLFERFGPGRVLDVPIAEDSVLGCAVGAALTGLRPIVEILYVDFIFRAMDQLINQAAKYRYMTGGQMSVPLVIRTGCGYGSSRGAQHSQSLEGTFLHFPGLKVVVPSNPADAKGLFKAAVRDDDPVLIMDHFLLFGTRGPVPEGEHLVPLGKAEVKREGRDITVVALSLMVMEALRAAEELSRAGIEIEVLDPRTLVPLDLEAIVQSVKKTNRLMVVEGGCKSGGVGSEIVARIVEEAFDYLDGPPVRLAVPDTPIPFASAMEKFLLPGREKIVQEARRMMGKR
jgi:pyruvate/2-oxoglutarate/acetoin dehydrogenase E1 component